MPINRAMGCAPGSTLGNRPNSGNCISKAPLKHMCNSQLSRACQSAFRTAGRSSLPELIQRAPSGGSARIQRRSHEAPGWACGGPPAIGTAPRARFAMGAGAARAGSARAWARAATRGPLTCPRNSLSRRTGAPPGKMCSAPSPARVPPRRSRERCLPLRCGASTCSACSCWARSCARRSSSARICSTP